MVGLRSFRRFCSVTSFVVILHILFVQAMVACGALHHHFHDHACDAGHECAVTLALHGGYDDSVPDIVPVDFVPKPPDVSVVSPNAIEAEPAHLVGGVLAHAPPRGP